MSVSKKKKGQLPSKICIVCHRPFTWRKKWARHWHEVKYCSQRCRRRRDQARGTDVMRIDPSEMRRN